MRAIVIDHFGEQGSLRDVPVPEPGAGELLVRVSVAGVNPVDWKTRDGKSGERPMPMTLGQDFAGRVERAGDGVIGYAPGERIFGVARTHGSYAEYTIAKTGEQSEPVAKIPDGVSDAQAATLPTPALTALASLEVLGVKRGTVLLIHGATGAVGGYAARMAQARGAHVIGTIRDAKDAGQAREFGVSEVIDTSAGDPVAAVRKAHAVGVDAVLDLVSTDAEANAAFAAALSENGVLVSTNHVADEKRFEARGLRAVNIVMNQTPQSSTQGLEQVARMVADGTLLVKIGVDKPLADGVAVLEASKEGGQGKAVLRASADPSA